MHQVYRKDAVATIIDAIIGFIIIVPGFITVAKYFTESLTLTDGNVIIEKGVLSKTESIIPYSKINNIYLKKSLLGFKSIGIETGNEGIIFFNNIENGNEVKKNILARMKKN